MKLVNEQICPNFMFSLESSVEHNGVSLSFLLGSGVYVTSGASLGPDKLGGGIFPDENSLPIYPIGVSDRCRFPHPDKTILPKAGAKGSSR